MIVGMERYSDKPTVKLFKPRPHSLLAMVRNIARNSGNVAFSEHALDQMDKRGITQLDVLRVLRVGDIVGDIEAGKMVGEWKCKIVERRKRARDIGVATIVVKEGKLFIKTAEWEDL